MSSKLSIPTVALAILVILASCGNNGSDNTQAPVPAPLAIPILSNVIETPGTPPATSPDGPSIDKMDTSPALDIINSGGTFALMIIYDSVKFPSLDGLVFYKEGDPYYFILSVGQLPGDLGIVSFHITEGYPEGDYYIQFALLDKNGNPGEYHRALLHIAKVATLEIVDLFPISSNINPNVKTYEPLNVTGRVIFSIPVTTSEFTLEIKEISGATIPGTIYLMPGNLSATFIPSELLAPAGHYSVTAALVNEDILQQNLFDTQTPVPLGANSSNLLGKVYSFAIGADNVVEPEAAKTLFGLVGSAIPPFLIVVTEADPVAGTFSASGALSTSGGSAQDMRVPMLQFAQSSVYDDPYFFAGPTTIPLVVTVAGWNIAITFNEYIQSGSFLADGSGFENGAVSLYIDSQEIAALLSQFLGTPISDVCKDLQSLVGITVCDDQGHIVARAVNVSGSWESGITALYDLTPDAPSPTSISAAAGGIITVGGLLSMNGAAMGAGNNIAITSPVGTVTSPVVTAADGTFSSTLTVAANDATSGTDIVVTFDAVDLSAGQPYPLQRTVHITVDP